MIGKAYITQPLRRVQYGPNRSDHLDFMGCVATINTEREMLTAMRMEEATIEVEPDSAELLDRWHTVLGWERPALARIIVVGAPVAEPLSNEVSSETVAEIVFPKKSHHRKRTVAPEDKPRRTLNLSEGERERRRQLARKNFQQAAVAVA